MAEQIKERPILFSAEMVRAILEGRKTQTRRVMKKQPQLFTARQLAEKLPPYDEIVSKCPYGQPGDRLWVREKFSYLEFTNRYPVIKRSLAEGDTQPEVFYWADGKMPGWGNWTRPKPSIHMPRWASRITLEITALRVERLKDISEADAEAEGMQLAYMSTRRSSFLELWDSINKKHPWTANPWVWVVEFKRVLP